MTPEEFVHEVGTVVENFDAEVRCLPALCLHRPAFFISYCPSLPQQSDYQEDDPAVVNVVVEILKLAATASASEDDEKWRSQVVSETASFINSGTRMSEQRGTWFYGQWYNATFRQPIFRAYVEWVRI